MDSRAKSLLDAATRLTIDSVAESPFGVSESHMLLERYESACREGFTLLPVQEVDGIHRVVETSALRTLTTWAQVLDQSRPLKAHDIVSRHAPLFSVLRRFERRPILFAMGSMGIDGVVTLYDLNRPAAHLAAFGMCLVVEQTLNELIDVILGDGLPMSKKAVLVARAESAKVHPESIKRLRQAGTSGEFTDLLSCLQLRDKVAVLKTIDGAVELLLQKTVKVHAGSREALLSDLDAIRDLRNAIAHQSAVLDEYHRTCRSMATVYAFVSALQ